MDEKNVGLSIALRAQFELQKFNRRERIAVACLQGLLASDPDTVFCSGSRSDAAPAARKTLVHNALAYADALIEELGEPFP